MSIISHKTNSGGIIPTPSSTSSKGNTELLLLYAPTCAQYTCILCRRIILLDTRHITCSSGSLPVSGPTHSRNLNNLTTKLSSNSINNNNNNNLISSNIASSSTTTMIVNSPIRTSATGFLNTSRMLQSEEEEAEAQRRRRELLVNFISKREEAWRKQQQEQQHKRSNNNNNWTQLESEERQALHPAIKYSLQSSAGNYGPLSTSPLSPWRNSYYAQLKNKKKYETQSINSQKENIKLNSAAQARIVARLSPYFSYQYAWFPNNESEIYINELWRMLNNGASPPPVSSSYLTVQRGDFPNFYNNNNTNNNNREDEQRISTQSYAFTTPEVNSISESQLNNLKVSRRISHLSLPTASLNSPLMSPTEHKHNSSTLVKKDNQDSEEIEEKEEALINNNNNTNNNGDNNSSYNPLPSTIESISRPYSPTTLAATSVTFSHIPKILNMQKIEMMPPQSVRNTDLNKKLVQRNTIELSSSSPPPPPPQQQQQKKNSFPNSIISRESFISLFSKQLMRSIVYNGEIDLPLCPRCWKEAVEGQQREASSIIEDVISLFAAKETPDATSLVLCYRTDISSEEKLHHEINNNDICYYRESDYKYQDKNQKSKSNSIINYSNDFTLQSHMDDIHNPQISKEKEKEKNSWWKDIDNLPEIYVDINDVIRHESLRRLHIQVCEAEDQSQLFSKASQVFFHEIEHLSTQRKSNETACNEATALHNAQELFNFFEIYDNASGLSQRVQNVSCSQAFISKTRAMLLAFPISTTGPVATIAGLRLGQVPKVKSRQRSTSIYNNNNNNNNNNIYRSNSIAPLQQQNQKEKKKSLTLSGSPLESNSSSEATSLLHILHMQQAYTRTLLGSTEDFVSTNEINNACGYLINLLQHLIDWHHIRLQSVILWPDGEKSRVELITFHGNPPKETRRAADFFINENFFSWKTFGTACVIITGCVQEIALWLTERLKILENTLRDSLTIEDENNNNNNNNNNFNTPESLSTQTNKVLQTLAPSNPPYKISNDKIDGFPIRHGEISEELWTIGMKKLLAVVQWCVLASRDVDHMEYILKKQNGESKSCEVKDNKN